MSKSNEGDRKRNYKLIIDPVLKGRGHQKIYRYDGEFEGQSPVIPKDPRSRRTRLWSTRTKADLPVPKFKIDKYYIGLPPQRDIILNGLNDNVDRKFLISICEKFGTIEGVKIFYDPLTKRHMGKARVGFNTSASAKLAVAKLDGTSIMGCIVHADFEHKVDIKHPVKNQVSVEHEKITARTTPPTIERIPLPTPPPSGSSQSPSNSTPSTPGSVGLIDPRTRGVSTSSISTEHFRGPSSPPHRTLNTTQVTKKLPLFEPVSPPHQKVTVPPPPPPDAPPPPLPDRVSPPTTTKASVEDKNKHTSSSSKDYKECSKYPRDTHKSSSRQPDNDWRRRERDRERNRDTERDRYDRYDNSYKSRSDRGNYRGKNSHYYKDYSSRRSDSRDSYNKSRLRHPVYSSSGRDSELRRSRDSDSGSDKNDSIRLKTKHEQPKTDETKDKKDSVQKSDVKTTTDNNGLYNLQATKDFLLSPVENSGKETDVTQPDAGQTPSNHLDDSTKAVFDSEPALLTNESKAEMTDSVATIVQPIYEDISPVSSPVKPMTIPSFPVITQPIITVGLPETTEVKEASKGITEDNDDAMSLSSISSNEETLEVTSRETTPAMTIPPTGIHPYPPHYVPFMPPFNPSMPPPPTMTHMPMMPPMTMTIPPHPMAHPLVPPAPQPIYPPQFLPAHAPVPTPHIHQPYQVYPPGHVPPPHEQPRPALKKTWKAKISDEVLAIMTKELEVILKRDVTQRLVEDSAFKTLDGWWDNTERAKVSTTNQATTATTTLSTAQTANATTTTTNETTVSALFSTSITQGGAIGLGLRASLPKMPSFRKRQPDIELKRKQDEMSSKDDSDSEYSNSQYNDGSSARKKMKNDELFSAEESMEGPPATSVRTKEKQSTVGSSLYTNIYSSLSESEASLSDADSDSNWDDDSEDERSLSSESSSEYPSDNEESNKEFTGIPRTPPGTPPDTPPQTPPHLPQASPHASRTPSITPPPSPVVDNESIKDDLGSTGTLKDDLGSRIEHSVITDSTIDSEESKPSSIDHIIKDNDEHLGLTEDTNELVSSDVKQDSSAKGSTVISDSSPSIEKTATEDDTTEEPPKPEIPIFQYPPEFPVRPYWQDNQLVYDFLVSGLDYEDASYFKVGFENLERVGSDCISNAYWSFHPTTTCPAVPPAKGRKQKMDNGVRVHNSGSARCEGYYKIGMQEKAKYLETARRQVDKTQMVDKKKAEEKEANKAKQQSRENRALQRRLAASFQNEDFGDIVKFNQLKVRKKKLTFSKSRIHDWGLFALEPIGPDEMVIEYIGEVVRQAIADDREKRYEKVGIGSSYLFRVDSDTIIDATKYGNLARFINHCCEPNCYAKVVTLESEKRIVIYSKRDIAVNEEITYDYKFPLEDDKIPCLCGASQCRGTLN